MRRHQTMMDPESPLKHAGGPIYDYKNDDFKTGDPWYSSGQASPQSDISGSFNNFGMYTQPNMGGDAPLVFDASDEDYDNEPPLLEELGINFQHILTKTQAVLYPIKVFA